MKKLTLLATVLAASALTATGVFGYEAGSVAGAGKIAGKVSFKGAAPAPRLVAITKDVGLCGNGNREIVEVAVKGGALKNAVVYVSKIDQGKVWGGADKPLLDQKGCSFTPDMLIVKKGADMTIRNSDPTLHNIHTYEIIGKVRRTMFNVGQPDKGDIKQAVNVKRANAIKIECDAHDFMHAWAFAADNPYADATDASGSFSLDGLPAGDYEVKAWHPVLGEQVAKVTVKAGATANTAFEFSK